jgi:tetratricopeptide (TPR) repeat protein
MIAEIQELQASVDANPEDTTSVLRLANLYFDVRFFQRAVPLYERYLLANPANPDARVDLGTSHFELSVSDSAGQEEHLRVAEESFLKALEYAPKHPLAHFNLGIINLRQGRVEEARKWLEKCAELAPDSEAGRRARQLVDQHITS